jgi:hypothetical protein
MNGYDKYLEFQYRWSGDFYSSLFEAISRADEINLERLAQGFPEEVAAYKCWTRVGLNEFLRHVSPDHKLRKRLISEYHL